MQVYADVVFAINLIMDIFILWIVNKLCQKHAPPLRLVLAGLAMSLMYCLLVFSETFRPYANVFAAVFIMATGILICFSPKDAKEFIKLIVLAHIASFALGGIGMAMFYYTNVGNIVGNMLGYSFNNFSIKLLIASSCIFYILITAFTSWTKKTALKKQVFYPIKIFYNEAGVNLTALVDTGNSLRDPISHVPVIIAEFNSIKEFLPDKMKLIFYEKKENDLYNIINTMEDGAFSDRLRMIPFSSLGKENGMLLGFRPDKVEIVNEKQTEIIKNVVIGIYNFNLSREGKYQGLLSPELIRK